ncbi:DUF378 domain-containing protein, partial [bacterium]|nr:DUF378 domain-containing protein [bacterium]
MNVLKWISYAVVLIGALNWGLVGIFSFDIIGFLFGDMSALTRVIYTIVGLCALVYFVLS